jgi:hypothetical protein
MMNINVDTKRQNFWLDLLDGVEFGIETAFCDFYSPDISRERKAHEICGVRKSVVKSVGLTRELVDGI